MSIRRPLVPALMIAALLAGGPASATVVNGGNVINQTWTAAGSPYEVMGDVTIPAGAFLTIEAGTSVRFDTSDLQASGVDAARVEVIVDGTLEVNGTSGSPVSFETLGVPGSFAWYGVRVRPGATECTLTNLSIRHAQSAILHQGAAGVLSLTNVDIDDCNHDLSTTGGGSMLIAGTLRASRISGPLVIPSGARLEHNGGQAGTVGAFDLQGGSTYACSVRGPFDSDRIFALGTITLGATLELDLSGLILAMGETALLMLNDDVDAVSGAFAGLPEGAIIPAPGMGLQITYVTGTGNDVGLRAVSLVDVPPSASIGGLAILDLRPNPAAGEQRFILRLPPGTRDASLEVLDIMGRHVWSARLDAAARASGIVAWNGRDDAGRAAAPGVYLASIVADGTRSAAHRIVRLR